MFCACLFRQAETSRKDDRQGKPDGCAVDDKWMFDRVAAGFLKYICCKKVKTKSQIPFHLDLLQIILR